MEYLRQPQLNEVCNVRSAHVDWCEVIVMSAQLDDDLLAVRARLGWSSDAAPGQCCAVAGYDSSSSSAAALAYASG